MTLKPLSQRARRLLPGVAAVVLVSLAMLSQSLRSQLATDREIIAAQLTRQLLQVAEGLAIYAEFSGEAIRKESPVQIQAGLNRLIFGQPGALRLAVARRSGEIIANSFSSKGDYIGENTPLPPCLNPHRPALADLRKYGELTVRICSSTTLLIERLIERDDRVIGSLQAFVDLNELGKEILRTASLRHAPTIRLNAAESSSELACRSGEDERAICLIETGAFGWVDALPDSLITLVLILLVTLLALLLVRRFVIVPFTTVFAVLERVSTNTPIPGATIEVGGILSKLQGPLRTLNEMASSNIRLREESAAARVRTEVAQQVAHDIRSPLAALQSVDPELKSLPESTRVLLRNAIQRISDIAHQLQASEPREKSQLKGPQLLSVLIEELMSEKRAQYRHRQGEIELSTWITPEASILFAAIDSSELKRALSNLVNNAVESIAGKGRVRVGLLTQDSQHVQINIVDDGIGIPEELLDRVGERGLTTKPEGQGLGIAHALKTVETAQGRLNFKRRSPRGTEVTIDLPSAPPPSWFPGALHLPVPRVGAETPIIAIDDDRSIHSIWQSRLKIPGYELLHCSGPREFDELLKRRPELKESALFLMDQEFAGETVTGLKLIETRGIAAQSVLITSRFEAPEVLAQCKILGLKLLPKGLAGFIPIRQPESPARHEKRYDLILVDDDPIVRMTWELASKTGGRKILTVGSLDELEKQLATLDRTTPIYLDQALGDGISGIDVGDSLAARGFSALHIATGSPASSVPTRAWIRSIRDKTPPNG